MADPKPYSIRSKTVIDSFQGEYRFLSNFWPCEVVYEGRLYPSAEHAYQASKECFEPYRVSIQGCRSPGNAKRLGKGRGDKWFHEHKVHIMHTIVRWKFTNTPVLCRELVSTGDAELIEGNTWGDTFWGVYKGEGRNVLGKILMLVREECRLICLV